MHADATASATASTGSVAAKSTGVSTRVRISPSRSQMAVASVESCARSDTAAPYAASGLTA
ncbi:hypothetical protein ACFQV2_21740 [Actinokineospora soli]|uniref:Uncharacterized protein n=1 Tax=Actinokineospora soli TaxID=1048753 RepID=A0ABW2TPJ6_9PSEU